MSNFKRACRAIQSATGIAYQSAHNKLRARVDNGKTLDENVAEIIDELVQERGTTARSTRAAT